MLPLTQGAVVESLPIAVVVVAVVSVSVVAPVVVVVVVVYCFSSPLATDLFVLVAL